VHTGGTATGQEQPLVRVTTRLVVTNVVVHDKSGAIVGALTRDDFIILDDGKPQKIAIFSVNSRRSLQSLAKTSPSNVFSNRIGRQGAIPTNVVVILLDGLDTRFSDQAYARQELIKFLGQLQPGDSVAIYALGNHFRIVQDFTGDPSALVAALGQRRGQAVPGPGAVSPAPEARIENVSGPTAAAAARLDAGLFAVTHARSLANDVRELDVLSALEAIADHISGLPGRKSLVWVTGGLPLPQSLPNFSVGHPGVGVNPLVAEKIRRTLEALNQADVALYPVDARGLFTDPAFSAENRARSMPATSVMTLTMATPGHDLLRDRNRRASLLQHQ
jgi:VWFA-related protein